MIPLNMQQSVRSFDRLFGNVTLDDQAKMALDPQRAVGLGKTEGTLDGVVQPIYDQTVVLEPVYVNLKIGRYLSNEEVAALVAARSAVLGVVSAKANGPAIGL